LKKAENSTEKEKQLQSSLQVLQATVSTKIDATNLDAVVNAAIAAKIDAGDFDNAINAAIAAKIDAAINAAVAAKFDAVKVDAAVASRIDAAVAKIDEEKKALKAKKKEAAAKFDERAGILEQREKALLTAERKDLKERQPALARERKEGFYAVSDARIDFREMVSAVTQLLKNRHSTTCASMLTIRSLRTSG
jgi:hypothetical protein